LRATTPTSPALWEEAAPAWESAGEGWSCCERPLCQDRADNENCHDELKNQWGWAGYATRDPKRCGIAAQLVGLVYNWWSLFVKFVQEGESREAITSRPLMLGSVAKSSSHQRQRLVRLSPFHVEGRRYALKLNRASGFLSELILTAEQLDCAERWRRILQRAFKRIRTTQPSIGPPETAPT